MSGGAQVSFASGWVLRWHRVWCRKGRHLRPGQRRIYVSAPAEVRGPVWVASESSQRAGREDVPARAESRSFLRGCFTWWH